MSLPHPSRLFKLFQMKNMQGVGGGSRKMKIFEKSDTAFASSNFQGCRWFSLPRTAMKRIIILVC